MVQPLFNPITVMTLQPQLQGSPRVQRLLQLCERMEGVMVSSALRSQYIRTDHDGNENYSLHFRPALRSADKTELARIMRAARTFSTKEKNPFLLEMSEALQRIGAVYESESLDISNSSTAYVSRSDDWPTPKIKFSYIDSYPASLDRSIIAFFGLHLDPMVNALFACTMKPGIQKSRLRFAEVTTGRQESDIGLGAVAALGLQWYPALIRDLHVGNGYAPSRIERKGNRIRLIVPTTTDSAERRGPYLYTTPKQQLAVAEKRSLQEALEAENGNLRGTAKRLGLSRRALFHKLGKYGLSTTVSPEETASRPSVRDRLADAEKNAIQSALEAENGNLRGAAKRLGLSRRALLYKLAQYDL